MGGGRILKSDIIQNKKRGIFMSKIKNIVGLSIGGLFLIFSIIAFSYDVDVTRAGGRVEDIHIVNNVEPETESNRYYGGDAYSGIQQAAAQTANNVYAVYNAVEQTNDNLAVLNDNIAAETEATQESAGAVTMVAGLLFLGIAFLLIAKHLFALLEDLSAGREAAQPEYAENEYMSPYEATSFANDSVTQDNLQ